MNLFSNSVEFKFYLFHYCLLIWISLQNLNNIILKMN
jgi:hypothetical protein